MRPGNAKKHAIVALGKVNRTHSKDAILLLREIVTKGEARHRGKAVRYLGWHTDSHPKLVCEALLPLISDQSDIVRLNIARVFSDKYSVFPKVAFNVLSILINDENAEVRNSAFRGIKRHAGDFLDDTYHIFNNLHRPMPPRIRWFVNKFCLSYERMNGLTDEAAMRLEKLKLDRHTYIQKRLDQI